MVVLAGDMDGHVGSNSVGYDGMHGGYGFGDRNADGSRILEFVDGLNLVICNTLFMKQESRLVTYVAGSAKSTVHSLIHSFIYLHSSKNIIHDKMYMQGNKAAYATLTVALYNWEIKHYCTSRTH